MNMWACANVVICYYANRQEVIGNVNNTGISNIGNENSIVHNMNDTNNDHNGIHNNNNSVTTKHNMIIVVESGD